MIKINQCVLCHNALCSKDCGKINPARLLQAVKFENELAEFSKFSGSFPCKDCSASCEKNCPQKVEIREILTEAYEKTKNSKKDVLCNADLSTDICGVKFENPFILSSSVIASSYEMCARAFEMGWSGICYKTISMMEMHEASPRFSALKNQDKSFLGFKNIEQLSDYSLEENMEIFRRLKKNYPSKRIIASIMGRNEAEWEFLSKTVEEAGADVIELNFSCPNMEEKNVGLTIGQDPELVKRFTAASKRGSKLPVLAKLTPNITDITIPARAAIEGGADGISVINTIRSITGVDLETMAAAPDVNGHTEIGGYSGRAVKPIALRFIAEIARDFKKNQSEKKLHLSGMGGIYTWKDAVEFISLGAGTVQMTTSVMEYGYRIIDDLISGLKYYMESHGIKKISSIWGAALKSVVDAEEVERDTILFPVTDKEKCTGCGRCYISCRDGGHSAIIFDETARKTKLVGSKCVGCHLCVLVCPEGAIGLAKKRINKQRQSV